MSPKILKILNLYSSYTLAIGPEVLLLYGPTSAFDIKATNIIEKLLKKKYNLLREVLDKNEDYANKEEIKIDELCTFVMAKYVPRAKNLRTVLMILKINNDLERMADHAVNIAHSALFLIEKPQVKPYIDLPRIAAETIKMLKDSINSFIDENAELAKSLCERDDIVDNLRDQITRELITYIISDPSTIERALHLIKIAQNVERITDLATNICEDVIFIVEEKIIKHHIEE